MGEVGQQRHRLERVGALREFVHRASSLPQGALASATMETRAAFDEQVRPHRAALLAHAYRMLGNLADAEDVVQESLVRAWQHRGAFEGRASLRSWLWTICVRAALTRADRTARRELPGLRDDEPSHGVDVGAPSPEVPWLEPLPDAWLGAALDARESPEAQLTRRQSVALAFLAAVQLLPPLQRAVLLLTSVLGWSAAETAEALETTVPAVNSALQRARQTLDTKAPGWSAGPASPPAASVSARYVEAWARGDAEALAGLLRDDVTLAMPPFSAWFRGKADVVAFLGHFMAAGGAWRARVCQGFNGVLAVELTHAAGHLPPALHVITVDERGAIVGTVVFVGRVGDGPTPG
ncbi:MAG: RNA polymerase subunit sigma-70 [Myxococcaceae bacterium]|nr:RNA polymerase subunit sigma-70 [Myxococcaceae bacterium]